MKRIWSTAAGAAILFSLVLTGCNGPTVNQGQPDTQFSEQVFVDLLKASGVECSEDGTYNDGDFLRYAEAVGAVVTGGRSCANEAVIVVLDDGSKIESMQAQLIASLTKANRNLLSSQLGASAKDEEIEQACRSGQVKCLRYPDWLRVGNVVIDTRGEPALRAEMQAALAEAGVVPVE